MIIPYIFTLNITLSVIILVIGLLFLILTVKVVDPLREKNKQIRKDISGMSVTATENVTGFSVIRMFALEKTFNERFTYSADALLKAQKKYGNFTAVLGLCNIFIWLGGESLSAIAGILLVLKGSLNVADLSALVSVSSDIIRLFTDFSDLPTQLQKAFSGIDRIYELLDVRPEPKRYDIAGNVISEGIAVDDLDYSYTEGRQVLNKVSIHAEKGQTIALVGDSGSGKTTLVKIIAGLYCAKDSKISLCGKPLKDYTLFELRKLIAYVPQDAYVFNGSIYDNISYGRDDASEADIYEAARNANAEKFILEKPDGYRTQVGERGIQLSGGERQRLAIARAILKNAPVLLLDEATSSLDSESESAILDTLDRLLRTHTSVVVAHRLSTVKNADRIYMMVKGKVIGEGKHEDLLESCAEYRELYYKKFRQV
jgi:ABC-type multidrug transport system fused ATPase/permease subunit